jgi:hypothetical protein
LQLNKPEQQKKQKPQQVQKRKKGEEEWLRAPYVERESKRSIKAQATIKDRLMVELGYGTR